MIRPDPKRRGISLVEVMVAVMILGIGSAAATNLATQIVRSNEQVNFQAASYEVFNRVAAEIQQSSCQVYPGSVAPTFASADPGLVSVAPGAWNVAAIPSSAIRTVGDWEHTSDTRRTGMPMKIEYQVNPDVPPIGAIGQPYGFNIMVRIREFQFDLTKDNLNVDTTSWIRTWPVRKNCVARTEPASRGGWP